MKCDNLDGPGCDIEDILFECLLYFYFHESFNLGLNIIERQDWRVTNASM